MVLETPRCESATGYRLRAVDLEARPTAVVRLDAASAGTGAGLARTLRHLDDELRRQRVSAIGPPFVRHLDTTDGVQVEVGYLVGEPIEDGAEAVASGLPGGPAIMAVGVRPEEVDDAVRMLGEWLSTRGFRPAGAGWRRVQELPLVDIVLPYRWR